MKKRNLALIFFFLIFFGHSAILTKNSQGYIFHLIEFTTDKSQYLINETLSIHTKWDYLIEEGEESFLRLEIYTDQGILVNQSQNYDENGQNLENLYLITLINLNLAPQPVPLTLVINLHFFLQDKISGEYEESFDTRSVQVSFFNLTYSYSFRNSTNLCFSDPIELILDFWERDLDHFKAGNLNLSCKILYDQDQIVFESDFLTSSQGTANLSILTENFAPGNYSLTIISNYSSIYNQVEITQNFIVFPGNLSIFTRLDPFSPTISIPEENIFSEISLYISVWYKNYGSIFPDLAFNWTLLDSRGYLYYLGNLTFFSVLTPILEPGEYLLAINGSSKYFTDIFLNPKITVLKRDLAVCATVDEQSQTLSLTVLDKETGKLLPSSLLGDIELYEINPGGSSKRISYDIHNNTLLLSPTFLREKLQGYSIVIYIEESQYFSYFSSIISSEDLTGNHSNTPLSLLICIMMVVSMLGIITLYFYFARNKKKAGFLLKRLKFEI